MTSDGVAAGEPLPDWDSAEMRRMFSNREVRIAYKVLFESLDTPLTMPEIRARVARDFAQENIQTDRRMRQLRSHFIVDVVRTPGRRNEVRYVLRGWRADAAQRTSRQSLPARVEAQIYTEYGNRCAMCGKSPKDEGVRLVIDHKIPLHLGGTNDADNLQPLCEEHNHAKQALFAHYDRWADALRASLSFPDVHLRIGELLKAAPNVAIPVDLVTLAAREENRGDPTRRMRELRDLGWVIDASRRKVGRRTVSYYTLRHAEPWPQQGPGPVIRAIEADRRKVARERGQHP